MCMRYSLPTSLALDRVYCSKQLDAAFRRFLVLSVNITQSLSGTAINDAVDPARPYQKSLLHLGRSRRTF